MMVAKVAEKLNGNGNGTKSVWLYILEKFGVPTLLLLVGGYWLATCVGQPLVNAHCKFLEEQIGLSEQQAASLRNQVDLSNQQAKSLEQQTQTLGKVESIMHGVTVAHETQLELLRLIRAEQEKAAKKGVTASQ